MPYGRKPLPCEGRLPEISRWKSAAGPVRACAPAAVSFPACSPAAVQSHQRALPSSGDSRHGWPILFSAPMVRALHDGRKTQTRRVIKPKGRVSLFDGSWSDSYVLDPGNQSWRDQEIRIKAGDRLWVREAWRAELTWNSLKPSEIPTEAAHWYEADGEQRDNGLGAKFKGKLRPSMFMPRWASRLTLTVTDVRAQRLQDISDEDAIAEGLTPAGIAGWVVPELGDDSADLSPVAVYRELWSSINGAGSWGTNPWVAAYTFTVERRNIDAPALPMSEGR